MSTSIGLTPPEGGNNPFSMAMLTELSSEEFAFVSENMASSMVEAGAPFSQDEIIDYLSFIRDHGIAYEEGLLTALETDNPLLPVPRSGFQEVGQQQGLPQESESEESALLSMTPSERNTEREGETLTPRNVDSVQTTRSENRNPWFDPNPQTAFMISYMSLMVALQAIKKQEAELGIQMLDMMMETARDIADLIKKSAKLEAKMHIASAISSIVQGSIAVGGAAIGVGAGRAAGRSGSAAARIKYKRKGMSSAKANTMARAEGLSTGIQTFSAFTNLASSVGQFAQAGEKLATAKLTIEKGKIDAQKAIQETFMKIIEREMSAAFENFRSSDEQISQVLNNLKEILSKIYQAHDMRLR